MKRKTAFSLLCAGLCLAFASSYLGCQYYLQSRQVVISPAVLDSDEALMNRYGEAAKRGDLLANVALYERFFLTNNDLEKARPFLESAANAGDELAIDILRDPDGVRNDILKIKK